MPRLAALSFALVFGACSGAPAEDVRLTVDFACEAARQATERIELRVIRGGCGGFDVIYEATLSRTQTAPEQTIPPGLYGVHATAYAGSDALATGCREERLPSASVNVVLSSESCLTTIDADAADAAARPEDAGCGDREDCAVCALGAPDDCRCWEKSFGSHTYWFCTEALAWPAARALCRMHQRDLVIVDDAAENAFLTREIRGASHWIGANDRGSDGIPPISPACAELCSRSGDEGLWTWVDPISGGERGVTFCEAAEGTSACAASEGRYTNWAAEEPTNGDNACTPFVRCETGEDCAVIIGNRGTWQDATCTSKLRFVCESY